MTFSERLDLKGRRLLVTGAGAGIGLATARLAAEQGAGAVALLDLDAARADAAASAVGAASRAYVADAGDYAAMAELLPRVESELGSIDMIVNAAGNSSPSAFLELGREEWDETITSHVKSTFNTCRLLVPGMVERRFGRVVNIASIAGKRGGGFLGRTAYATAKAAINGFTKALARETAQYGIRVNSVNPGITHTARLDPLRADPALWQRLLATVPLGREAEPAEIAAAIVFLLSDASDYVTGETMNVDGGFAME